ncbi:MAG: hypothetical protein JW730_06945 [Anaerolineales bacterium]|nr:hypothetical protein [Anaerolineales bacterium]
MERTLLYYPTIVIRNDQWIRQSILYWDSIGSIVPYGMEGKLHQSYDIEILQREGLFRVYQPDDYVQRNQRLTSEFEAIIDDKYLLNSELPKRLPEPRPLGDTGKFMRDWLFEKKMYHRLAEKLVEKSLARREGDKLLMNPQLAMIYMALLAKHMANDDQERLTIPSTDYPSNVNLIYPNRAYLKRHSPARANTELTSVMSLSLHNILPVPIGNVQVADILRFKSKYRDELLKFRNVIYEYQGKLKQVTEPAEVKELNARFVENIQLEVKNLSRAFQGDRIHFILGTLRNLFAIDTPVMVSAMIVGLPPQIQFPLSIAGATIAGALSLGEYFLDTCNHQLERLSQNQYSYLYQAQREGIVFLP